MKEKQIGEFPLFQSCSQDEILLGDIPALGVALLRRNTFSAPRLSSPAIPA